MARLTLFARSMKTSSISSFDKGMLSFAHAGYGSLSFEYGPPIIGGGPIALFGWKVGVDAPLMLLPYCCLLLLLKGAFGCPAAG